MLKWILMLALAAPLGAKTFVVSTAELQEYLLAMGRAQELPRGDARDALAEEVLQHHLLALLWNDLGHRLAEAELQELEQHHRDIAIRMARRAWTAPAKVSDKEVRDYFELSTLHFYCRHILSEKESEIRGIAGAISAGADFSEQAFEHSIDVGSAELGGMLGAVHAGETVAEFEDVLFAQEVGQVSEPFLTPFGWHLLVVDSIQPREEYRPTEAALAKAREDLERKQRRFHELDAQQRMRQHIGARFFFEADAPGDTVVASKDTAMTRGQLDERIMAAFSATISADMFNDGLRRAFAENWIDQLGWLSIAHEEGYWLGEETLERIGLRERLMKSALFTAVEVKPGLNPSERDCWNYIDNHPAEFLEFRHDVFRRLVFDEEAQAREARRRILREGWEAEQAGEGLELQGDPRDCGAPFEIDPVERASLDPELRSGLADTAEGTWSQPMPWQEGWALWYRIGRRLPDIEESDTLEQAVEAKVREAFLQAELKRIASLERERRKLKRVKVRG